MTADKRPERAFLPFFASRALSTFGDEVWAIALPIYLAVAGYTAQDIGYYSSAWALGTIVGFLILPRLARTVRPSVIALSVDTAQLLVFGLIAALVFSVAKLPLFFWMSVAVLIASAESIWFGASESLIANTVEAGSSQSIHRLNYLSSTLGPCLAPLVASLFFLFFGLPVVALLNASSFLLQIFTLLGLRRLDKAQPAPAAGSAQLTVKDLFVDPYYRGMFFLASCVKLGLVGALPFIPFFFAKAGVGPLLLSLATGALPVGSVLGAAIYRNADRGRLASIFLFDSLLMMGSIAALIVGLSHVIAFVVVPAAFGAGFFSARYTIELRAMRQMVTPKHLMPKLVSLQGLTARLVTPLGGIIFGFAFSGKPGVAHVVALLIGGVGSLAAAGSAKAFSEKTRER